MHAFVAPLLHDDWLIYAPRRRGGYYCYGAKEEKATKDPFFCAVPFADAGEKSCAAPPFTVGDKNQGSISPQANMFFGHFAVGAKTRVRFAYGSRTLFSVRFAIG